MAPEAMSAEIAKASDSPSIQRLGQIAATNRATIA